MANLGLDQPGIRADTHIDPVERTVIELGRRTGLPDVDEVPSVMSCAVGRSCWSVHFSRLSLPWSCVGWGVSPLTNYAQNYAREEPIPAHSCSLQHLVSFEFVQKLAFYRTFLAGSEGLQNLHPRFKSGRRLQFSSPYRSMGYGLHAPLRADLGDPELGTTWEQFLLRSTFA